MALQDIWVIAKFDGPKLKDGTIEVLSEGVNLTRASNGHLCAVVFGNPDCDLIKAFFGRGVKRIFSVNHPLLDVFTTDGYVYSLTQLITHYQPLIVLASAESDTEDYFPRLGASLKVPFIPNCVQVEFDQTNSPQFTRPTHQNKVYRKISCPGASFFLATLIPGVIGYSPPSGDSHPEVIDFIPELQKPLIRTKLLNTILGDPETIDIREADAVVCGGKGACNSNAWKLLLELAKLLGASIGGTRMALDSKYIGPERLIGQTGKSIHTVLYFAIGISGAYYHLQGLHTDHLISINSDRFAPILSQSKLGVIGDLNQIIPALCKILEEKQNQ